MIKNGNCRLPQTRIFSNGIRPLLEDQRSTFSVFVRLFQKKTRLLLHVKIPPVHWCGAKIPPVHLCSGAVPKQRAIPAGTHYFASPFGQTIIRTGELVFHRTRFEQHEPLGPVTRYSMRLSRDNTPQWNTIGVANVHGVARVASTTYQTHKPQDVQNVFVQTTHHNTKHKA